MLCLNDPVHTFHWIQVNYSAGTNYLLSSRNFTHQLYLLSLSCIDIKRNGKTSKMIWCLFREKYIAMNVTSILLSFRVSHNRIKGQESIISFSVSAKLHPAPLSTLARHKPAQSCSVAMRNVVHLKNQQFREHLLIFAKSLRLRLLDVSDIF